MNFAEASGYLQDTGGEKAWERIQADFETATKPRGGKVAQQQPAHPVLNVGSRLFMWLQHQQIAFSSLPESSATQHFPLLLMIGLQMSSFCSTQLLPTAVAFHAKTLSSF